MDLSRLFDEPELTELYDPDIPRVDLVGKGANGIPRFLLAKSAGEPGLLDPEFVRGLIAKSEPARSGREQVAMPSGVTLSGSPGDIAAFIHKAAQQPDSETLITKAEAAYPDSLRDVALSKYVYDRVIKAEKYDAAARKKMAASGAAMEDGSYPIDDEEDLTKAIRAVGRGGASHDAIRKHIISRARSLGKSSMIPDDWNSDGSLKEKVSKDMGPDLDEGKDGLDPTVPLAAPDDDKPGDPADPGSPAWEAIDAATAMKWTSIAVRLKNALCVMADREMLEAASADPDDAENAFDLQDAMCAVDYAISTLAVFAAGEQAEADLGGEEMAAVGKALDELGTGPLGVIEGLAPVAKAGRTLSAANEELIRQAAASLTKVLATLPAAPTPDNGGRPVAKEGAAMPATATKSPAAAPPGAGLDAQITRAAAGLTQAVAKGVPSAEEQARNTAPVNLGGTTGMGQPRITGPAASLPDDGPQQALPGDVPGRTVIKAARAVPVYHRGGALLGVADEGAISTVMKADDGKKAMCVVYNQAGKLMGIVDPDDITPVANSEAEPDEAPAADDGPEAAPAADMTPAPPAAVGTPADQVAKTQDPAPAPGAQEGTDTRTVLKNIVTEALAEILGAQGPAQGVAKQADVDGLSARLGDVLARLETVEKHPAAPGAFLNGQLPPEGAVPPARPSLRGQDRAPAGGPPQVDIAKAKERKREFTEADPADQNRIAKEMQTDAIGYLAALHQRPTPA